MKNYFSSLLENVFCQWRLQWYAIKPGNAIYAYCIFTLVIRQMYATLVLGIFSNLASHLQREDCGDTATWISYVVFYQTCLVVLKSHYNSEECFVWNFKVFFIPRCFRKMELSNSKKKKKRETCKKIHVFHIWLKSFFLWNIAMIWKRYFFSGENWKNSLYTVWINIYTWICGHSIVAKSWNRVGITAFLLV